MDLPSQPRQVERAFVRTIEAAKSRPLRVFLVLTLVLLVSRPAMQTPAAVLLCDAIFIIGLQFVMYELRPTRGQFVLTVALLFSTIAAHVADALSDHAAASFSASLSSGLLVASVTIQLFLFVVRARRISQNTVLAAICVYVMLGVTFGFVYQMIFELDPKAFNIDLGPRPDGDAEISQGALRYFSMITLTTVGFGDIVPVSPEARAVASLQALLAQIYLAAVVARLVGVEVANSTSAGPTRGEG